MRQFVSLRFWVALAALVALTVGLWFVLVRDDSQAVGAIVERRPDEHRLDLLSLVYSVEQDPGFAMTGGESAGADMRLILDGTRTMVVKPGTRGSVTCTEFVEIGRCAVAADLLGNAVVWFSLVPVEPDGTAEFPGIVAVRDDNWVLLANGWEVQRASVVERRCEEDTPSLVDLVDTYGERATAVFDFDRQQVVAVVCPA